MDMTHEPSADDQHGVFSGSTSSLTKSGLEHAVTRGRLVRLRRDLYVSADSYAAADSSPSAARARLRQHSVAAALAVRDAAASHRSGAVLSGVPIWSWQSQRPCITVPQGRDTGGLASHAHRARLPAEHVVDGRVPRTALRRTILDLAREHGVADAVVAGDFALHEGWVTPDELRGTAADCGRFPGIKRARRVIDLLDPRMESPLESVSRLVLRSISFPEPTPQVNIYSLDGRFLGRVDNYWDEFGVAGEVDGREKYDGEASLWDEKRRQDELEDAGLVIVRWGMPEVRSPASLRPKLYAAVARAARRSAEGRGWTAHPAYPSPLWAA